ncbi:hypothetical protein MTR67_012230 [Solanum verrucosum]|uniref:Uncharacterized protein n=1 Tax=Solanum verrucosum TaxID=315347 RepID=A0AAF0QAY2_SOLVR|nr:hypothetical protein MTR67_012230 [Solanum verrucosum]
MDFPLVLGNGGAPLQDFNLNILPDLNLPAELESYQPLFPQVPLGTLSLEEQRAVDKLVRLEGRLIWTARCVLESLGYSPQSGDIKFFVQIFIVDIDSSDYDDLVLALIDENSPIFLQSLEECKLFLADNNTLAKNLGINKIK